MVLSIIIVSWNVADRLKENLVSIFQSQTGFDFEVFVVDNASSDNTVEIVKKEFPQVKLIENKENLGFAKANNIAIQEVQGDYILLLNPDMRVLPNTLKNMADWMGVHKEAGVASCLLKNEKGEIIKHVRRFPTVWDQLAVVLKIPHIIPQVLNKYIVADFDYAKTAEVDSIRGAFFMIRREVIEKLGGLDERYFIWFEEVDYCKQVKNAGWKIMYTPEAEAIDYIGQSFSQVKRGEKQKYFRDSMLKYFQKWHKGWENSVLKWAWKFSMILIK